MRTLVRQRLLPLLLVPMVAGCAVGSLPLGDLLEAAGMAPAAPLDTPTIVAGLKEALRVGTDRTVAATSSENGFLGNELIRIPLPEPMERLARSLRAVGLGGQVDGFEVAMNRAAERAAGEAAPVFIDAITQMSFSDARAILTGGDRAATDYFQRRTSSELAARFRPIVDQSMRTVGVVKLYDELIARAALMPLVPTPRFDLDGYVTDRALAGLFTVLAQEEARIRRDPAARTTELLRRVFASA